MKYWHTDEPGGHSEQHNKPDTKWKVCDSTHVRSPEESNPQRQEVAGGAKGWEG